MLLKSTLAGLVTVEVFEKLSKKVSGATDVWTQGCKELLARDCPPRGPHKELNSWPTPGWRTYGLRASTFLRRLLGQGQRGGFSRSHQGPQCPQPTELPAGPPRERPDHYRRLWACKECCHSTNIPQNFFSACCILRGSSSNFRAGNDHTNTWVQCGGSHRWAKPLLAPILHLNHHFF